MQFAYRTFFAFTIVLAPAIKANNIAFIKGILKHPETVGAFFPCSRFTAEQVCSFIDHSHGSLSILEIGCGTGALTKSIQKRLHNGDTLDLVEIMPEYCTELEKLFGDDERISLFCGSILDWHPQKKYDVIICSIPFNIFKSDFVQSVFDHVQTLAKPNATFSYIELMWVTRIKKAFLDKQERDSLEKTLTIMRNVRKEFGIRTDKVYLNVTPVYVHHLRFNENKQ